MKRDNVCVYYALNLSEYSGCNTIQSRGFVKCHSPDDPRNFSLRNVQSHSPPQSKAKTSNLLLDKQLLAHLRNDPRILELIND